MTKQEYMEELRDAEENVRYCLEDWTLLVDMKGLGYWASRVEELRKKIMEGEE